jgi:hypothetical protein
MLLGLCFEFPDVTTINKVTPTITTTLALVLIVARSFIVPIHFYAAHNEAII